MPNGPTPTHHQPKLIAGLVALLIILAIGGYLGWRAKDANRLPTTDYGGTSPTPTATTSGTPTPSTSANSTETPTPTAEPTVEFTSQTKSAHFVSSVPAHEATLTEPPNEVVLKFNFDLVAPSKVTVTYRALTPEDGVRETVVSTGETTISANKRELHQGLRTNLSPGLYRVTYTACWPDTSCHDGQFEFRYASN
ncbi:copper resistance protein CopC [Candidatus Berkelbacteria bacterium]|nr:copper resistance protein CopC [Candidatus Berkelbacteria bacterium]